MTPAQEAKEYADTHGFNIQPIGRRFDIYRIVDGAHVGNVGGYPASLNAMKRYTQEHLVEVMRDDDFAEPCKGDTCTKRFESDAHSPECIAEHARAYSGLDIAEPNADKSVYAWVTGKDKRPRVHDMRVMTGAAQPGPWRVGVPEADGLMPQFTAHNNRTDAVKALRQQYAGRSDARIVYVAAA